jgi:hypothetical protein
MVGVGVDVSVGVSVGGTGVSVGVLVGVCEGVDVAVGVSVAAGVGVGEAELTQLGNLNEPMRVPQLPSGCTYSFVYQNVQSSSESTTIAL